MRELACPAAPAEAPSSSGREAPSLPVATLASSSTDSRREAFSRSNSSRPLRNASSEASSSDVFSGGDDAIAGCG